MGGFETYTVPATDVPTRHYFVGGLVNTVMIRNLATVATAFVRIDFIDGPSYILYAGETLIINAEDTSTRADTGKIHSDQYDIRGDAVNTQVIWISYTNKAPFGGREDVTV